MMPADSYTNTNGDEAAAAEEGGSSAEEEAEEEELSLADAGAPARALAALNALRKSRQHYDVVLVAGGAEVAAHRAVLAAASPYLLRELGPPAAAAAAQHYRLEDADAEAVRALVEYAYTGRLRVRTPAAGRALYRAAWRLRVEPARAHLADRLLRRVTPHGAPALRALPDLAPHHLAALDAYIADNFDEICESGALAALPQINIEMMRDSSAAGGEEAPLAVAGAALAWLRDQPHEDVEELCARAHLLYVDERGALRDCGDLPAVSGDAPELQQYRRDTAARRRAPAAASAARALPGRALGERVARAESGVLAARRAPGGGTRALVVVRGRLAAARVRWSAVAAGGGGVARGAALGGERADEGGERRAPLAEPRCALGAAALAGRLLACGGYGRARVLRSAEAYCPRANLWHPLPEMRVPRARFPAARLADTVWVLGGSDGHAELDSVDSYSAREGWRARSRLPLAVSHAAAAADEEAAALYVIGGWAAGGILKRVLRYSPGEGAWSEAPPLSTGRAQCGGVVWAGAVWALGGCDAWHCLASTERLPAGAAAWEAGPALPTARRSMGACAWRGRLVAAGGSDGAASLRRTEWLPREAGAAGWRAGPALRRARAGLALADLEGALYAVGGFDGKEFLSCVECLYEPDSEWTTLCDPPRPRRALPPRDPGEGAPDPGEGAPDPGESARDPGEGAPDPGEGAPDPGEGAPAQ